MADTPNELKRIYVDNPESPGAGVWFTGEDAEKQAAEYRNRAVVQSTAVTPEAETDAGDTEEKALAKSENKARKGPETK